MIKKTLCLRCKGKGFINKNMIERPIWCRKRGLGDHWTCCICGKEAKYQEGDGKYIHSLCDFHYKKIIKSGDKA